MMTLLCWLKEIERSGHLPICSSHLLFGDKPITALMTSTLANTFPIEQGLAEIKLEMNKQGYFIATHLHYVAPVINYALYAKAISLLYKGRLPLFCRFVQLLERVTAPELMPFVEYWNTHPEQFEAYLVMSASYRDHHAYRHGLFQHSVEVAELAYSNAISLGHSPIECQIALLAGIFHDIGKVYSQSEANLKTYQTGAHECLNFSLLAEPLKFLATHDWDAHRMFSSMLAPYQQHRSEQYAVESIFRFADHASCSSNRTHVLFSGKPAHFRFLKNGDKMVRRLPA
ncbi:HDIG domain-containing metalloprotein [Tolumonas auensis]|uniref:HD domain-containing protein n=1 Tax=Tolumonas auensis TaxID=43948 RepID=UPI002AA80F78|nr:HDIG domain-containing metalloprotein [Tolumonas auensis]